MHEAEQKWQMYQEMQRTTGKEVLCSIGSAVHAPERPAEIDSQLAERHQLKLPMTEMDKKELMAACRALTMGGTTKTVGKQHCRSNAVRSLLCYGVQACRAARRQCDRRAARRSTGCATCWPGRASWRRCPSTGCRTHPLRPAHATHCFMLMPGNPAPIRW